MPQLYTYRKTTERALGGCLSLHRKRLLVFFLIFRGVLEIPFANLIEG